MNAPNKTAQWKQDLTDVAADLRTLRDEVRVQAKLATMDIKEEFLRLEGGFDEAQRYWNEVSATTVDAAKDLKGRFQQLKERLKSGSKAG